jgi:hypothetical protein
MSAQTTNEIVNGPGGNRLTKCETCVNSDSVHTYCGGKNYVPESRVSHSAMFAGGDAYRYAKQKPHGPGR